MCLVCAAGPMVQKARYPFRKLCEPCLGDAVKDAQAIKDSISAFAAKYGYSFANVNELGSWAFNMDKTPLPVEEDKLPDEVA